MGDEQFNSYGDRENNYVNKIFLSVDIEITWVCFIIKYLISTVIINCYAFTLHSIGSIKLVVCGAYGNIL